MQYNILWAGREYYSLENCLVNMTTEGVEITSTIIGLYDKKIYKVEYRIRTNSKWETVLLEIQSWNSDKTGFLRLEGNGEGNWLSSGEKIKRFDGCIDIDISLTPFTNTLPIKRLHLRQNDSMEIQVIYLDILEEQIRPVRQKYSCLSETEYHYENIPNDFEAIIHVDTAGFVIDYPSLFARAAILETNYR